MSTHEKNLKGVVDNARQLRARKGKYYERWKAGVLRYIANEPKPGKK